MDIVMDMMMDGHIGGNDIRFNWTNCFMDDGWLDCPVDCGVMFVTLRIVRLRRLRRDEGCIRVGIVMRSPRLIAHSCVFPRLRRLALGILPALSGFVLSTAIGLVGVFPLSCLVVRP